MLIALISRYKVTRGDKRSNSISKTFLIVLLLAANGDMKRLRNISVIQTITINI
jgi:hypothetical protein